MIMTINQIYRKLPKNGDVDIRYEVVRDEGPDHDKTIWMELFINGKALGTGIGKSKKKPPKMRLRKPLNGFIRES